MTDSDRGTWFEWFIICVLWGGLIVLGLLTAAAFGDDVVVRERSVSFEILPTLAAGQEVSVLDRYDFAPYVHVESPLYRAIYNGETKCCVWIEYTVRAEDVVDDNETDRGWWAPVELVEKYGILGNAHYRESGYDRGHLRSIRMSRGSEHWRDVNCLFVIVPQVPALNRGAISQLEADICDLALEHGWCRVTITLTGDVGDMPRAGPHQIPERILYRVESPAGSSLHPFQNGPVTAD